MSLKKWPIKSWYVSKIFLKIHLPLVICLFHQETMIFQKNYNKLLLYNWIKLIKEHYFGIKETGSCPKDAGRILTEYCYSTDQGRCLFRTLCSLNKDIFIGCKSKVRSHNKMKLYFLQSTTIMKIFLES